MRVCRRRPRSHDALSNRVVGKIASFPADDDDLDLGSGRLEFFQGRRRRPQDVGIEGTAQPSVARDHGYLDTMTFPLLEKRVCVPVHAPAEGANRVTHLQRIGPGGKNAFLRTLELGRRDHFHGFRDLLCFLDGVDFASD